MVLGERALALEARRDRRLEQLGELAQLRPRPRVVHALARVDHRPLGGDQRARPRATTSRGSGALRRRGAGV